MQQHESKYFARRHTLDPRVESIVFFFLKAVMLHIKLKGMGHKASHKHTFCPYRHPRPLVLGQNVKTFFFLK